MEFIVLVGGALFKNGKLLVVKRAASKLFLPGFCEIPGGKVEPGEELEKALKREFLEETGLTVEVMTPYNVWTWINGDKQCVEIDYLVNCSDVSRIKLNAGEHSEFLWIAKGEKVPSTLEMVRTLEKAFTVNQLNSL